MEWFGLLAKGIPCPGQFARAERSHRLFQECDATIQRIGVGVQAELLRRTCWSKISILHILGSLVYDWCTIRYL